MKLDKMSALSFTGPSAVNSHSRIESIM